MPEVTKKVTEVCSNISKQSAKNHPIKEHPIDNCEEYVQKMYIDMLCVMAQYENDDTENQLKFIRRIHAGTELEEPFSEHIKNSIELTTERFDEFFRQCKENKLGNIFFIDSIIIVCANGTPNVKQIEFLSEIADSLGIDNNHAGWLCSIAVSIIEQDADKYCETCEDIPHDEKTKIVECAVCYLKEFIVGVLVDTDDLLWIYAKEKTEFDPQDWFDMNNENVIISRKKVILENLIIKRNYETVDENDKKYGHRNGHADECICFKTCDEVIIDNCEFWSIGMFFKNCLKISMNKIQCMEVEQCIYGEQCFYINGCPELTVSDSVFKGSCDYLYGFLFYANSRCDIVLSDCEYIDIKLSNGYSLFSAASSRINISKCKFNNCHTYHNLELFYFYSISIKGCEVNNCSPLT